MAEKLSDKEIENFNLEESKYIHLLFASIKLISFLSQPIIPSIVMLQIKVMILNSFILF